MGDDVAAARVVVGVRSGGGARRPASGSEINSRFGYCFSSN